MINKPLVTVVTATTGKFLKDNISSVKNQTYDNVQHLVVIDGVDSDTDIFHYIRMANPKADVINLPYPTGRDQYNGHRIYGACTYLARGEYIMFLDEDNWMDPNHVESMVNSIGNNRWAYSLRKIVNHDGEYICNDDCESLGNWPSILNDHFVDVNCYMFQRQLALEMSPGWYRRARHPQEQPEVDRLFSAVLRQNNLSANCTGEYTINYRAGNRADSVQGEFFLKGNEIFNEYYKGEFPWRKKI